MSLNDIPIDRNPRLPAIYVQLDKEWLILMQCAKHPRYPFKRKPSCGDCLALWHLVQGARRKVEEVWSEG